MPLFSNPPVVSGSEIATETDYKRMGWLTHPAEKAAPWVSFVFFFCLTHNGFFSQRESPVLWERGKYSRNASQELSVPWAGRARGLWSQNPASVPTGTSSGESFSILSSFLTKCGPVDGGEEGKGRGGRQDPEVGGMCAVPGGPSHPITGKADVCIARRRTSTLS